LQCCCQWVSNIAKLKYPGDYFTAHKSTTLVLMVMLLEKVLHMCILAVFQTVIGMLLIIAELPIQCIPKVVHDIIWPKCVVTIVIHSAILQVNVQSHKLVYIYSCFQLGAFVGIFDNFTMVMLFQSSVPFCLHQ